MNTEAGDGAMRGEDTQMEGKTKVLSEKNEPLASPAQHMEDYNLSNMYVHTEHSFFQKKLNSEDVNARVKVDLNDIVVHQNTCSTPDSSTLSTQHSTASSCMPLHQRHATVLQVPQKKKQKVFSSVYMAFSIILVLTIPVLFMDVEGWWRATPQMQSSTSMNQTYLYDEKHTFMDSLFPPPAPQSFTAAPIPSSEVRIAHSGLSARLEDANAIYRPWLGMNATSSSPRWYCFTLEEYSTHFVASGPPHQDDRFFFRCGTRVVDIRTETRPEVLSACQERTFNTYPKLTIEGTSCQGRTHRTQSNCGLAARSSFFELRVVLVGEELNWHLRNRLNAVAQDIPLQHFNDDYCDCFDGTDELLTNACSMAGAGMPLAGDRWRSYLISNRRTRLYQTQLEDRVREELKADPDVDQKSLPVLVEGRVLALRSIELGGPVLPIRCHSDPTILLSPSFVGDGIVDCCDGSDEGLTIDNGKDRNTLFHKAEIDPVEAEWTSRRERMAAYLSTHFSEGTGGQNNGNNPPLPPQGQQQSPQQVVGGEEDELNGDEKPFEGPRSLYWDRLHPYYISAAAVLVDKGYSSLFTCPDLNRLRLANAEFVLDFVKKGHRVRKARVVEGWDALGRFLVGNRSIIMERLNHTTNEIHELRHYIKNQMIAKRASNPIAAGVPEEHLERYYMLEDQLKYIQQDYRYLDTVLTQKVFGKYYEYFPLYDKQLKISANEVARSDRSTSPVERHEEALRRVWAEEIYNPKTPIESRRSLHIDNVSFVEFALSSTRHLLAAQSMGLKGEGKFTAEVHNVCSPNEKEDPKDKPNPPLPGAFPTHLFFILGHWHPFSAKGVGAKMGLGDLAGDVDLPRRALVRPFSELNRGGGRLQWPTRTTGKAHFIEIPKADEESGKQRILSAAKGNIPKEIVIPVLQHTNAPDRVAVQVYEGGDLRCEVDPPLNMKWNPEDDEARDPNTGVGKGRKQANNPPYQYQSALVSFVCHTSDEVLLWAFNGKCQQEIIVGTPSACTQWVLNEAERKVRLFKEVTQQYEPGNMSRGNPSVSSIS
ncbi:unnamed protein product [Phytomonas sp. Hart1]|nr:unnamed protein product [Phytomonas sp. Hart1]|eukprot:CCW69521.1 unnamed protein product [Phytomonas sp. isolate Hart1]